MCLSNCKSKKSVIIIISAICAALIIALGICVGQFYSSTTASVEEYCKENSFKGAESFDINKSSELDGYVLCVSKDGDDSKGQELFIFYEKPFGAIKNTNRDIPLNISQTKAAHSLSVHISLSREKATKAE